MKNATQYAYDAENVRTKVIKNAGTQKETVTTYVTDCVRHELSRVLEATTTDKAGNTEIILYTYGNGMVAQEKGKEYLLYHFNHLRSTTAVADTSGEIKYTYAYNIFGKLLSGNYGEVEFLYNGQYGVASDANGLYYMRARYYNIDIMRFINQDILTGSIDSSQSLNRYAYVEGNPVNFLDPFGLEAWEGDNSLDYIEVLLGLLVFHFTKDIGTFAEGYVLNFSPGIFGLSAQIGGSIDPSGNFAIQITVGFNVTTGDGFSGSAGGYRSRTNAPNIEYLEGDGYNFGGSTNVSSYLGAGIDLNAMSVEDRNYYGITISSFVGVASPEVHAGYSHTKTTNIKGNVYETYRKYLKKKFNT